MKGGTPTAVYLKDYTHPDYTIDQVDLSFELRDSETLVHAQLVCKASSNEFTPLVLQGQGLILKEIRLDGVALSPSRYTVSDEELTITQVPQQFVLETLVQIDPLHNRALEGLYKSKKLFCTQCEAEGFRKITYYLDRPDVMASFTTTIIADLQQYPVLLSNGNLLERGTTGEGKHWVKWVDPHKKPCYLFALVAGDLQYIEDHYVTKSGRNVILRIYVEADNIGKCDHAMVSLKKAMAWDEEVYGLEYDLDIFMIVAVSDFNMGAMENKGLNIFNAKYVLANPETATDDDYLAIEGVIAHEYFHNWTGNRVTCRDWFQLSLKEGLTVFRDQEFSADMNSRAVMRIQDVRVLRSTQFIEDAGPMSHPVRPDAYVEINNFYTTTIYNKGAEVVRLYQTLFGIEGFRKGMDLYFQRHDGEAVTTNDFYAAMVDANTRPLQNFEQWYTQAGTPLVQVKSSYDAAKKEFKLELQQTCPATPGQPKKLPFLIPIKLGLLADTSQPVPLFAQGELTLSGELEALVCLDKPKMTLRFSKVESKPVVSLLREFSAPVKLEYAYEDAELAFLLAHDTDHFNRWEAGQRLATTIFLRLINACQTQQKLVVDPLYIKSLRQLLKHADEDPALVAEMMTLPSPRYVAEQLPSIDVDAIEQAYRYFAFCVADNLYDELRSIYQRYSKIKSYSLDPNAMGRRKLKNICLSYLCEINRVSMTKRAYRHYQDSNNMTDMLAGLRIFSETQSPYSEKVIKAFYQQWRHDPLVMDKWLGTLAMSRLPNAVQRVRALTLDPVFDLSNPNKVYALLGGFCHGNMVHFHASDGSGYELLAEFVAKLDPMNSQVAARLLKALVNWRRFDGARQEKMRATLEQLVAIKGLSKDCYEIASKSLIPSPS